MQVLFADASFAESTVVFAVDIKPPHDGASRVNLPWCETHATSRLERVDATDSAEWFALRPGRDASAHLGQVHSSFLIKRWWSSG
jgi:hypothetical protein